jgi:hypothetical protein
MLVKCTAKKPNESQAQTLGEYYKTYGAKHDSHLTVGKTYLVLGLVINAGSGRMAAGVSLTLLCDYGHIESYPIVLFEVLNGRVDPEWMVRNRPDGIVEVEPELLLGPHFVEDHLDGVPEAVKPFKELVSRMEQRAASPVNGRG